MVCASYKSLRRKYWKKRRCSVRIVYRIAVVTGLGIVCFSITGLAYMWRQVLNDALYALLLAVFSGFGFVYMQRAYAIRAEDTLSKLKDVPQIKELIHQAEGESAKIASLQQELSRLDEIIEVSSRQRYLQREFETLQEEVRKRLIRMEHVEDELDATKAPTQSSVSQATIEELGKILKLREEGYLLLKIGKRRIPLNPAMLDFSPAGLPLGTLTVTIRDYLARRRRRKRRTD